nr:GDP-mannose 4,6-dehydratase [Gemmatimonadota bacterium]
LEGRPCQIHGDGESSRDFCYIDNVLQANLLAAVAEGDGVTGEVFNVAVGERTTLNDLFRLLRDGLAEVEPELAGAQPEYGEFRPGDVRHSQADITKISTRLGYRPSHALAEGVREALAWYVQAQRAQSIAA